MTSTHFAGDKDDKDEKRKASDEDFALGVKIGKEEGKEDATQDDKKAAGSNSK